MLSISDYVALFFLFALAYVMFSPLISDERPSDKVKKKQKLERHVRASVDLAIAKEEREKYGIISKSLVSGFQMMLTTIQTKHSWEKEYCLSIVRQLTSIEDARIPFDGTTFAHAANLIRANFDSIERDYLDQIGHQNTQITQSLIYGCIDGDYDSVMTFFYTIIAKNTKDRISIKSSTVTQLQAF